MKIQRKPWEHINKNTTSDVKGNATVCFPAFVLAAGHFTFQTKIKEFSRFRVLLYFCDIGWYFHKTNSRYKKHLVILIKIVIHSLLFI